MAHASEKRSPALNIRCSARALVVGALLLAFGCENDDGGDGGAGGSIAGLAGSGGRSGAAGSGVVGGTPGGEPQAGTTGGAIELGAGRPQTLGGAGNAGSGADTGGVAAGGAIAFGPCGNPEGEGVRVSEDVTTSVVWDCPVYTLTKPIFVHSSNATRTKLTIAPGTLIRGEAGDLEQEVLPGALIVTRTGTLEAIGTPSFPIVFTSAKPVGGRAPGDWGGVVLLGRAPTNVPADLDSAGNGAGEMFIEGLPRANPELVLYGAPIFTDGVAEGGGGAGGEAGAGGAASGHAGAGGDGGTGSNFVNTGDPEWSCGRMEYVRIEFPGFEVAAGRELNGLTLAGCGRGTTIEHVQVHKSSDDGIELFGGTVDLKRAVITGVKDDALDWDQGYRGRMQFVAIQMHDDTLLPADGKGDNGIEADGFASLTQAFERPSRGTIYNLTLIASATSQRGMRLREGTQAEIKNAIVLAAPSGAVAGLVDIGDVQTADFVTSSDLTVENSIFFGPWPATGQKDSAGMLYVEADFFMRERGDRTNREAPSLDAVLPGALDEARPGWVPPASSIATEDAATPSDGTEAGAFFESDARYVGAFQPGGIDWTAGWTAYPAN